MHRPYMRPLVEGDWRALRDLRLHALRTEPGMYFSSLEAEFAHSEAQWRTLAANLDDRQRVFGLFEGEVLIGITAVFTYNGDPSERTAVFGMSYVRPEYRGQGHAQLYYEARFAWVRGNPRFTRVRVSHRRSNEPSRRAILRQGFASVDAVTRIWPDGVEDTETIYELELSASEDHRSS
jgi:RimJ/RimL family protein N-acetyltransferase